MFIEEIVLKELGNITGSEEVRINLDLDLFDEKIIDSFGAIELILALSESLGVDVTPGQINRELWSTPRKIIEYFELRVQQV